MNGIYTDRLRSWVGVAGVLSLLWAGCGFAAGPQPAGPWRIEVAQAAPWATDGLVHTQLEGAVLSFDDGAVSGPAPLGCANASYEFVVSPAEGMFQGGLPEPATAAAEALGVVHLPVATLRVNCDSGSFDYHMIAPDTLLTALDNVIWTLRYEAPDSSPVAQVQAMLVDHMTHDMAFTMETVARKEGVLSSSLFLAIGEYFGRPQLVDEVPPINGDPFTDSQEYPEGFVLGEVSMEGDLARVPVVFSDAYGSRTVEMALIREAGRWRIDDLTYEDGATLRELLRP